MNLVANLLACPHAQDDAEFKECLRYVNMGWIRQELPDFRVIMLHEPTAAIKKAIMQVLVNVAVFGEFLSCSQPSDSMLCSFL